VLAALEKYCLPLFDPERSVAVVVTAPGKVEASAEGLRKAGFEVEEREIEVSPEEMEALEEEMEEEEEDSDGMEVDSDDSAGSAGSGVR